VKKMSSRNWSFVVSERLVDCVDGVKMWRMWKM
jgi:hypothetical protein